SCHLRAALPPTRPSTALVPAPPTPTLLPYTTLFRSGSDEAAITKIAQRLLQTPGQQTLSLNEKSLKIPEPSATSAPAFRQTDGRSEEHTSELQSRETLVGRLLLEKKSNQDRTRPFSR